MLNNSSNNAPKEVMIKTKSHKVVMIGDSFVGKTSILDMYINNRFEETKPSIGAMHQFYKIKLNSGEEVNLDLWDTAGQERFRSVVPMYYKGAKAILICFDVTAPETFDGAKNWVKEIESNINSILLILVGNKIDLEDQRKISYEHARSYANMKQLQYFECSAKSNIGIKEIFSYAAEKIPKCDEKKGLNMNEVSKSNSNTGGMCSCGPP